MIMGLCEMFLSVDLSVPRMDKKVGNSPIYLLSMVVVAFSCKGVRLPLVGDGGKLEPLINMLISRGECAEEFLSSRLTWLLLLEQVCPREGSRSWVRMRTRQWISGLRCE